VSVARRGAQDHSRNPAITESDIHSSRGTRSRSRRSGLSLGRQALSIGVLLVCAVMVVGLSVPTSVLAADDSAMSSELVVVARPVQQLAVSSEAVDSGAARDTYGATSWAQILRESYGAQDVDYTVGTTGPIRWPFQFPVPITDGYGDRVSPCRGCSSYHQGVDFVPGAGQPIYAIATGVVTLREDDNWSYGLTIEIEHKIDGETITSKYAHMKTGSVDLDVGDVVQVWDYVGQVGDTGATTGPHLHFEIWVDADKVNPYTWLMHYASS